MFMLMLMLMKMMMMLRNEETAVGASMCHHAMPGSQIDVVTYPSDKKAIRRVLPTRRALSA